MAAPVHVEIRARIAAPPEALWPLLADTRRLNRAIGLPPVYYAAAPTPAGGSRITGEFRLFGRLTFVRWTEHPFEIEAPRLYAVRRDYHWGPIASIYAGAELTSADAGTDLRVFGDFVPRNSLGVLFARTLGGSFVAGRIVKQCRIFEQHLRGQMATPFPQLTPKAPAPAERLAGPAEALSTRGIDPAIVARLREHLATAPDEDVVRMRPFELADRWGFERRETLRAFLHTTVAGLVVMTWHVLCPGCRGGPGEYHSLRDLPGQAHCPACNITFDANFDRLVEVRFTVAAGLRRASTDLYCAGGPMNIPHVVAQTTLAPGGHQTWQMRLDPGSYRLRSPQSRGTVWIDAGPEGRTAAVEVAVTPADMTPTPVEVAAGAVTVELANRCTDGVVVVLEQQAWADTAATAAIVSTFPEFRDLFSSEVLAPGLELSIQNLGFLFTDLTGSTALYERIGQARAFRLVQDHFRILETAIAQHQGAIVKTIGDAIMAVFPSGADAFAAGLAIQRDIRGLDTGGAADPVRLVKVGVHQGPCLAVTLNDRLDYFGTTVNLASRIEHECQGGQVVASADVYETAAAQALLGGGEPEVEVFAVRIKGLNAPVRLARISPASNP